jgi:DNA-binding CsgD family transcriptional regulator
MTNFWMLIASSFYWAWFDVATFRPTLFVPFAHAADFFGLYFIITMTSGALFLLAATLKGDALAARIKMIPAGVAGIILAVCGSLLTLFGAWLLNLVPIVVGAILTGTTCSFFLLEWARMYSKQGAKSTGILISSAIALGTLIDLIVIGLSPLFAALFATVLPLAAFFVLFNTSALINQQATAETGANATTGEFGFGAISKDMIFASSKRRPFGLSVSLITAFFIFGLSFGFMQFNSAFFATDLYPLSSDILLMSRGATALIIFLAIYFFPNKIYTTFRIGILIGIAGFIVTPFISAFSNSNLISGFIIAVGYTTFDIITWTVLAEIAFAAREHTIHTFGPGRFVLHMGVVVGFLLAMLFISVPYLSRLHLELMVTIGYFMVIAETLLLHENSALWLLIRFNKNPQTQFLESALAPTSGQQSPGAESPGDWISLYGLTEREVEILRFLLIGRSTSRIAQALLISENTVNSHIRHIYRKLDIHNRQDLLDRFS